MSSGNADPEVLQGVGASLLHGISNVISAASSGAQVDDEEEESDSDDTDQETEEKLYKGKVILNHELFLPLGLFWCAFDWVYNGIRL